MFDFIRGVLVRADAQAEEAVVETAGVGYRISVSRRVIENLPAPGTTVTIYTELVANEREMRLYGFAAVAERRLFRLICSNVRNVGPATAVKILASGSVAEIRSAVLNAEYAFFAAAKGIGKKMSERIVRELGEVIAQLEGIVPDAALPAGGRSGSRADAVKALAALGFSETAAVETVDRVIKAADGELSVEEIIKQALRPK